MRVRLRPAYTPEELKNVYATPHAHSFWPDHRMRVEHTISLARQMGVPRVIADLSCGDAVIGRALSPNKLFLGDFAPGYEFCGPIEETVEQIPKVGMFICSETIEHLDNPDSVLKQIRRKADTLVLSTPIGEVTDRNPEHYWGWDADGVRDMLEQARWLPVMRCDVHFLSEPGSNWMPASYQIWGCK